MRVHISPPFLFWSCRPSAAFPPDALLYAPRRPSLGLGNDCGHILVHIRLLIHRLARAQEQNLAIVLRADRPARHPVSERISPFLLATLSLPQAKMTILDKILKGKPKTPQEAVEACKDVSESKVQALYRRGRHRCCSVHVGTRPDHGGEGERCPNAPQPSPTTASPVLLPCPSLLALSPIRGGCETPCFSCSPAG